MFAEVSRAPLASDMLTKPPGTIPWGLFHLCIMQDVMFAFLLEVVPACSVVAFADVYCVVCWISIVHTSSNHSNGRTPK